MGVWINDATEQEKVQTFLTFSRGLIERPQVYGVSAADAAEAVRLAEAADEAMAAASNPATRTTLATAAKREALAAARDHCARLARFIRVNPNISDADRLAVGVSAPTETRRVIGPPTTTPMLLVRGIVPGGHDIELFDSATPDRRGRARDCKGLELFVAYSPNQGQDAPAMEQILKTARPHGILTRGRATVIHPGDRLGSVANYIGRWINNRGEAGPWSQPVRMLLAIPAQAKMAA